jgi:hypothetical protein
MIAVTDLPTWPLLAKSAEIWKFKIIATGITRWLHA